MDDPRQPIGGRENVAIGEDDDLVVGAKRGERGELVPHLLAGIDRGPGNDDLDRGAIDTVGDEPMQRVMGRVLP